MGSRHGSARGYGDVRWPSRSDGLLPGRHSGLRERALPRLPARAARDAPRAATSGPGARRCSSSPPPRRPSACGASTSPSTASCGARATRPSASSTTSGSTRRARPPRPRRKPGSARAAARRLRARRAPPLPPGLAGGLPAPGRVAARRGVRVGLAPHSVRACPADWLEELGRYAERRGPRRCTSTPTSSRARSRSASPSTACGRSSCSPARAASGRGTTVVHATHADERRARPARPSRRARLRSAPRPRRTSATASRRSRRSASRGIGLCIGSDSNVRIDPLEELRELEGIARRAAGRRNIVSPGEPALLRLRRGRRGARARARGTTSRSTSRTRRCAASTPGELPAALVFGCAADVCCAAGRRLVPPKPPHPVRRPDEVRAPAARPWRPQAPSYDCVRRPPATRIIRAGSICVPSCHSL